MRSSTRTLRTLLTLAVLISGCAVGEDFSLMRKEMVREVQEDMRRSARFTGIERLSPAVEQALSNVERHRFVPDAVPNNAYVNAPLPIGEGQTISQPFIVGLMTELLGVNSSSKVLELGTGSGYQAAVLAELVNEVYTVEIVAELGRRAERTLVGLGYDNVYVRIGDGTKGWPEEAPFDGIIVTAAGLDIPDELLSQLKTGGKLVMPVGSQFEVQQLIVATMKPDGTVSKRQTIPVRFVPITGDNEY